MFCLVLCSPVKGIQKLLNYGEKRLREKLLNDFELSLRMISRLESNMAKNAPALPVSRGMRVLIRLGGVDLLKLTYFFITQPGFSETE